MLKTLDFRRAGIVAMCAAAALHAHCGHPVDRRDRVIEDDPESAMAAYPRSSILRWIDPEIIRRVRSEPYVVFTFQWQERGRAGVLVPRSVLEQPRKPTAAEVFRRSLPFNSADQLLYYKDNRVLPTDIRRGDVSMLADQDQRLFQSPDYRFDEYLRRAEAASEMPRSVAMSGAAYIAFPAMPIEEGDRNNIWCLVRGDGATDRFMSPDILLRNAVYIHGDDALQVFSADIPAWIISESSGDFGSLFCDVIARSHANWEREREKYTNAPWPEDDLYDILIEEPKQ